MVYLGSCPVKTRWHFNLVFAFGYDGLTLSKLFFLSTWHEFCSQVWYVSDHLFIFCPICLYRSALIVLRMQRSWPLAVGTWWAELNSLIYRAFHLSLIYMVLQFFWLKLFHCRLLETVPNWAPVQCAVNPSQVDKGCTSSDCSHRIENVWTLYGEFSLSPINEIIQVHYRLNEHYTANWILLLTLLFWFGSMGFNPGHVTRFNFHGMDSIQYHS